MAVSPAGGNSEPQAPKRSRVTRTCDIESEDDEPTVNSEVAEEDGADEESDVNGEYDESDDNESYIKSDDEKDKALGLHPQKVP